MGIDAMTARPLTVDVSLTSTGVFLKLRFEEDALEVGYMKKKCEHFQLPAVKLMELNITGMHAYV